jgi:TIR domain
MKIFVSHSWDDKIEYNQFGEIYQQLSNYELWIDKTELQIGGLINPAIEKAIHEADAFLVLWSKRTARSKAVKLEIETAINIHKPFFCCIIDKDCLDEQKSKENYSIYKSKYLKGRLCIDLTKENIVVGWLKVHQCLIEVNINKISQNIPFYDEQKQQKAIALIDKLKETMKMNAQNISFIQDTVHRIKGNATNRNSNNPYMFNMLDFLIENFSSDTASIQQKQIAEVAVFAKQVFMKYPEGEDETVKLREQLLIEKINQVDPNNENEDLIKTFITPKQNS